MTTLLTLFAAGVLTILLPCILPLVPIVLGVSLSGQHRARPLVVTLGLVTSFVASTYLLEVAFQRLLGFSDVVRTAEYYALALFGVCLLVLRPWLRVALAGLAAILLFMGSGVAALVAAAAAGAAAVLVGGRVAARLQGLGAAAQRGAQQGLGRESLLFAFVVGLTLGLVWAPCAGPALGFVLTLVREERGLRALGALGAYAAGAALPLLAVGYGGQRVLGRLGWLVRRSGMLKSAAGVALVATAFALHGQVYATAQTWLAEHLGLDRWGERWERALVGSAMAEPTPAAAMMTRQANPGAAPVDAHPALPVLPKLGPAPALAGLGPWYNSAPLDLASLRGKVVLVDFWTYSCINCIRTLPALRDLWSKYRDQPFAIIGVHAPEFAFERSPNNVAQAIKRHGLEYPIAQDNDFATWKAFGNQYWPAKYLIDAQGIVRYTHFGEGDYEATEAAVRSLLGEAGKRAPAPSPAMRKTAPARRISPETYVGERGWDSFANRQGAPDGKVRRYQAPAALARDRFALVGDWQLADGERQVLRSADGEIRFHALGGEVNLVLGLEPAAGKVAADVSVDGQAARPLTIDRHDLYNLFHGAYGEHDVVLRIHGRRVAAYAFTFGA
jgi:cytochrome c biogenesis protein CcdA/thiol-disulfide isomerase/thioredoxin